MTPDNNRSLIKSFSCAIGGLLLCVREERNIRVHIVTAAYVLFFSRFYDLSRAELLAVSAAIVFVLVCELINTAIEKTVDIKAPGYHPLAGAAKDIAAGAVLVSAVFSALVGILIFWEPVTISLILRVIFTDAAFTALFLASAAVSVLFIRGARRKP